MSITEQKSKTLCYNCAYPEDGLTSVDWCDGQVCQYCFDEKFVPYNKKYPMTYAGLAMKTRLLIKNIEKLLMKWN